MNYISSPSLLPLNSHLLFVRPYSEGKKNLTTAIFNEELPIGQKVKHALAGIVLIIPVINTIALIIFRTYYLYLGFHHTSSSKNVSRFEDEPFVLFLEGPTVMMLTHKASSNWNPQLSQRFIDGIFAECLEQQKNDFTISSNSQGNLIVKYENNSADLTEILGDINWATLDEKWQKDHKDLQKYLERSLIFENIKEANVPLDKHNLFIRLYTSYGFYSWLNPLLRKGQLQSGVLSYSTAQTNEQLLQKNQNVINRIGKELLFISLVTTANLNALPQNYEEKGRVIRMAHVPKDILEDLKRSEIVQDRGFMSASAPGGGFAGGGPCNGTSYRIKFVIQSKKGKHVNEFSLLPENEVLFRPFTKFKVLQRSGDEASGFRIELEEISE